MPAQPSGRTSRPEGQRASQRTLGYQGTGGLNRPLSLLTDALPSAARPAHGQVGPHRGPLPAAGAWRGEHRPRSVAVLMRKTRS